MKISNPRDFRSLVLDVEGAIKSNHYLRIVNIAHGIEKDHSLFVSGLIDMAINRIVLNRSEDLTFEQTQEGRLKSFELRLKLAEQSALPRMKLHTKKRTRKQNDDAPKGADSSVKQIENDLNPVASNYGVCDKCSAHVGTNGLVGGVCLDCLAGV
ncbi:hypothetical protein OHV10_21580 [Vibrio splendidus]|uniref:hypothetical protein n=1 Tax=Vibrio splendidus TaxID=29497 RepID=UPI0022362F4B|nr:hypothetical protein [Vibrio splendidus]MCW4446835.1 hypothetical protein [Vibrio splendidus]